MYIVTIETDDGTFMDDPVFGDSKQEAIELSKTATPKIPNGCGRMLYYCSLVDEIVDEPA